MVNVNNSHIGSIVGIQGDNITNCNVTINGRTVSASSGKRYKCELTVFEWSKTEKFIETDPRVVESFIKKAKEGRAFSFKVDGKLYKKK
jgi:hypothetical protein